MQTYEVLKGLSHMNYSTHRLYFGEVETPYKTFQRVKLIVNEHTVRRFDFPKI